MGYELTGLDGKVAVVTGAGRMRSIGRSMATELARAGCDVVVTGTGRGNFTEAERAAGWGDIDAVADEIRGFGRRAIAAKLDVSDADAVDALAARVVDELGRVDILVNNAAPGRAADRKPTVDVDRRDWHTVIDVNLNGALYTSQAFARAMLALGKGGSIVNISSVGGKISGPQTAAYSASKAGLQSLTATMAKELGRDGIRVNAICPGIVDTGRLDDLRRAGRFDEVVDQNIPLGRAGTGLDIAAVVVFLCSDQGSWVTGQSWNVDGGMLTIR